MERLWLYRDKAPLRSFALGPRYLEIGRGAHCDVVIHDAAVADRAYLVHARQGTVVAYDLRGKTVGERTVLGINASLNLGAGYSVRRGEQDEDSVDKRSTDRLAPAYRSAGTLSLLLSEGARRVVLRRSPVTVGSATDNRIVLHDSAVSRYHCRFEPFDGGVMVRDLGSRNGTWVSGHRVERAELRAGVSLRLGRTDVELVATSSDTSGGASGDGLLAESPAMLRVVLDIDRYAELPWPVLIQGESGVGKERVAHALHLRGPRKSGPFVALNAGGLPGQLVETELFGHERGAFTGAAAVHRGVFEQAHGGTLFLDEIGELPFGLQSRLLRVLETWQVRRVGGERDRPVDVRLICATHRDLRSRIGMGTFRPDLFYRINRLLIEVPPLRRRVEDIQPLALCFLKAIEGEVGHRVLSDDAVARLVTHGWPGNARELRNVVCSAAAVGATELLSAKDIDDALRRLTDPRSLPQTQESVADVVRRHHGNVSAAARTLGMPRSTLRDRLKTTNGAQR